MFKTAAALIVFVFGLNCVTSQVIEEGTDKDERILGGSPAADGQIPYQVQIRSRNEHHCGGSIISNLWVLTAGHCIYRQPIQDLLVVVGTINSFTGGIFYRVVQPILREGFEPEPSLNNDIALLRVDRPIDSRYNIKAIQIAHNAPTSGMTCTVSGWGMVSSPIFSSPSHILLYLNQNLVDIQQCYRSFLGDSRFPPVRGTNICAFNDFNRATCHGDSGGPLVYGGAQYGIVSCGASCGKGVPDVYTSVYAYRSWIALKSGVNT